MMHLLLSRLISTLLASVLMELLAFHWLGSSLVLVVAWVWLELSLSSLLPMMVMLEHLCLMMNDTRRIKSWKLHIWLRRR